MQFCGRAMKNVRNTTDSESKKHQPSGRSWGGGGGRGCFGRWGAVGIREKERQRERERERVGGWGGGGVSECTLVEEL